MACFKTLYIERGVGMGANMVGLLKQIVVIDLQEDGKRSPMAMINPEIIWRSEETQTYLESSLCYPGISADITRAKEIKVKYLDYDGKEQELVCEGFLSTVVQHEVDYLVGVVFLDYLSPMKRNMLMKKMQKFIKRNPPHIHSSGCSH